MKTIKVKIPDKHFDVSIPSIIKSLTPEEAYVEGYAVGYVYGELKSSSPPIPMFKFKKDKK